MRRLAWFAAGAAAAAVVAAAAVLWLLVPALFQDHPPGMEDRTPSAATDRATYAQEVATTRTGVLAGLAGLGALVTIGINYRNSRTNAETLRTTQETFRVTERGHLTQRYTAAIEQLGDAGSIAIRLGGIYALEQLAVDSGRPGDQATVVEVLSAFIRLPRDQPPLDTLAPTSGVRTSSPGRRVAGPRLRPALPAAPEVRGVGLDVQAALTVLGRLPGRGDRQLVARADLVGADLTGARLFGADLTGASLAGADLTRADLYAARLFRASLYGARLTGADLTNANLKQAPGAAGSSHRRRLPERPGVVEAPP